MLQTAMNASVLRPLLTRLLQLRNRHCLFLDAVTLSLIPALALALRLDGLHPMQPYLPALLIYTVSALVIRLPFFYAFGLYRRYWRYATVDDLVQIVLAVISSTIAISALFFIARRSGLWEHALPRSMPFISGLLTLVAVCMTRFSMRWAAHALRQAPQKDARRVLIVGAGDAGQRIAREMLASARIGLHPVGFLDDDPHKQGLHILNLPVLGGREHLPDVVRRYAVEQVIIAIPSAPGKTIREYVTLCEEAGVPAKTVPGMSAILEDRVSVSQLRNVDIEDLLRREPVQTDIAAVQELIRGKRVLITGGGGSIGSELCRQVLKCAPGALAIVGHGENSVFEVHNELQGLSRKLFGKANNNGATPPAPELHALIADIRFSKRIRGVVQEFQPDIIFHAAAHKHVPLMEMNPTEAITNNVFGTKNLLDAALAANVAHFVMISTDKAVNPTSVMGASKRAAELLVLRAAKRSGKPYVAVRFGNVLGSRGSVVPTFKRQIAAGGPITISHPEMRRFFMTIPEAVQLVLQASVLGNGGEIFMLDMGEPVKIIDLARDLIELSGLEVGHDIEIVCTGIRPGEKLYEELFLPGECYQPTHHEKIRIARNAGSFVPVMLDDLLAAFERAVVTDDREGVVRCLKELIPEFTPDATRWGDLTVADRVPIMEAIVPETALGGRHSGGRGALPAETTAFSGSRPAHG